MKQTLKDKIAEYYTQKVKEFGATPEGVDWNGEDSQYLRFYQLSKVVSDRPFSIIDYGCGYGEYLDFLSQTERKFDYTGFDISNEMIKVAKEKYKNHSALFVNNSSELKINDYLIASGIFNVRNDVLDERWISYIEEELQQMNQLSQKGFAFNMLTKYSDKAYMKDYLFYADPLYFFDFCKRKFSKKVALLHDYDLYEYTIIVKK